MTHVNVLLTSAGRRVELLTAFRAAYAAEAIAGRIIATDIDRLAPALRVADVAEIVPPIDSDEYVPTLLDICERHDVHLVFPLVDPDIPVLAAAAGEFNQAGAKVGTMSLQNVQVARDKWATAALFRRVGVPAPESWLGERLPDPASLTYPVFIKPRFGSAAANTARVDDADELRMFLHRVPEPVVQELLSGPEITSDLAYSLDGEFLGICQRKRIAVRSGEVQKGVTVWDETIARHCLTIGRALQARGPITIQCLFKNGVPRFTEINARFGGGLPLAIAAGLDSPRWYLALEAGRRPAIPDPGRYTLGLYLTRFDQSFFLTDIAA